MTREIPGYYYDSAKRKYFRIEDSRTAPAQAAWSSQNVKRRAAREREDERRRERLLRAARGVKRAPLRDVPLMGGLLAREAGEAKTPRRDATSDYGRTLLRAWAGGLRSKGVVEPFVPTARPGWAQRHSTVSSLWVGDGAEHDGLGLVLTSFGERQMGLSYLPLDEEERIDFRNAWKRYPRLGLAQMQVSWTEPADVADIAFHEPSGMMLVAYENVEGGVAVDRFKPDFSRQGQPRTRWELLRANGQHFSPHVAKLPGRSVGTIHTLRAAPRAAALSCIAGTDRGIIAHLRDGDPFMSWLTLPPPPRPAAAVRRAAHFTSSHRRARAGGRGGGGGLPYGTRSYSFLNHGDGDDTEDDDRPPWQGDVLSVDFAHQNSAHLILAGTRSGHICLLDLRVPPALWRPTATTTTAASDDSGSHLSPTLIKHTSSVAHVRSVSEHEVLAAGPRSAMCLYDLRFHRRYSPTITTATKTSSTNDALLLNNNNNNNNNNIIIIINTNSTRTQPVVEFPAYRNEAHLRIGLDVLTEDCAYGCKPLSVSDSDRGDSYLHGLGYGDGGGGGRGGGPPGALVAAAHDDGTVGVYSLRDGSRLAAGDVGGIGRTTTESSSGGNGRTGDIGEGDIGNGGGPAVVKSLSWRTLPGERYPGLWVGEGGCVVKKYSFWA